MIPVSKFHLGSDVREAITKAKDDWRRHRLQPFEGRELLNYQVGKRGAKFFKAYVGHARSGDLLGKAGSRRLVLLEQSGQITEMYFSDDEYRIGSWSRITDF